MKTKMIGAVSAVMTLALAATLGAGAAHADASCNATCNTKSMDCQKGGKAADVCLAAWHACKTACATPPKVTVTKTSPGSVTVKATTQAPAPTKH